MDARPSGARRSRTARLLLAVVAAAALATAGIVVNLVLLDYADSRNDPVGKISPRATITQPAPPVTSRSTDDDGGDDHDRDEDD